MCLIQLAGLDKQNNTVQVIELHTPTPKPNSQNLTRAQGNLPKKKNKLVS